MNTRSLRFQLGLWYAALLTSVFILLGTATVLVLKHYLEGSVRETQLRRTRQIAQTLSPQLIRSGPEALDAEIEARFSPDLNNRFVRVRQSNGKVLYRSPPPQDRRFDPQEVPLLPWPLRPESSRRIVLRSGDELLLASRVLRNPGEPALLIESGAPLDEIQSVLRQVIYVLLFMLLAAVTIAGVGGYFLVGRALAAVDRISRSAEQISLSNLSDRLPIARSGDEIELLSLSLNRMIQRLDEAFQNSKRFVADASHELRTPLTVLRGELEALIEREKLSPAIQERLGSTLEEVDRLAKVVEGLLTLSRLDAGEAHGLPVRLDLAGLTVATAEQMSLLAEDKQISIRCEAPRPVLVAGDRTRLKQVVVNLLDNAIKYTPEGGRVTLRVASDSGQALLEVADTGLGISREALPFVFERFFRADKARTRELGGAGLGLAIVRSICIAHGGEVEVQSVEGKGSRFQVRLPLATEADAPAARPATGPAQPGLSAS